MKKIILLIVLGAMLNNCTNPDDSLSPDNMNQDDLFLNTLSLSTSLLTNQPTGIV